MIVLKNRAAYVQVIEHQQVLFHKNKPPNGGGLTGRLLAALGIVETGVYRVSFMRDVINKMERVTTIMVTLNGLDARIRDQAERADQYASELPSWDKEVTKLLL